MNSILENLTTSTTKDNPVRLNRFSLFFQGGDWYATSSLAISCRPGYAPRYEMFHRKTAKGLVRFLEKKLEREDAKIKEMGLIPC